jgi:hypothetical protein
MEQAVSGGGSGSFTDELIIEEDARALVHFLGDGGDEDGLFGCYYFHTSGNGESFKDEGMCRKEFEEECPACLANYPRRLQIATWCWVYVVYHKQQKMSEWEPVMDRSRGRLYKETVNGPKILKKGVGRGKAFLQLFVQYYEEYGSLNNRDYLISRTGSGFDTTYSIIVRGDRKELTVEQQNEAAELPSILDYYKTQADRNRPIAVDEGPDSNPLPLSDEDTPF